MTGVKKRANLTPNQQNTNGRAGDFEKFNVSDNYEYLSYIRN